MKPILITGRVHGYLTNRNPSYPVIGDCLLRPGANYTGYVDVFIYDGDGKTHTLCLDHGHPEGRKYNSAAEIGPIMSRLMQRIQDLAGKTADFGYPHPGAKRRAYHPRLMTYGELLSRRGGMPF